MPVADLSHPIRPGMPAYPGTDPPAFREIADYEPDGYRERELTFVSHTGTHLDAPAHMVPGGKTLDEFPASHFIGPACVLDATDVPPGGTIETDRLDALGEVLKTAAFLLIRTGYAAKWGTPSYFDRIPLLTPAAADRLAGLAAPDSAATGALRGVGLDLISVDPVGAETFPIHHALLGAGLVIIENLTSLEALPPAGFTLHCLPLPLSDADGAPCRAAGVW